MIPFTTSPFHRSLNRSFHRCKAGALVLAVVLALGARGYETDAFTNRHLQLADSTQVMNEHVNEVLANLAQVWSHGEDDDRFVQAVYKEMGGPLLVDRMERWAIDAPEIARLPHGRRDSIYHGVPIYAMRAAAWGLAPTIKVNDVLIGTDKIGHFFSQGRKFYRRYRKLGDERRAAAQSINTERGIFGKLMTGIYSNADLVANYEGFLFYLGLFSDGAVADRRAIFVWQDGRPVQRRQFDWADHINAFWDEALNPNRYDGVLRPHMEERLLGFCSQYLSQPELYAVSDASQLYERYQHIGIAEYEDTLQPVEFFEENCR